MKTINNGQPAWAELYQGSGRPTGRVTAKAMRAQNGDVAPGWVDVTGMPEDDFWAWQMKEEHYQCHSPLYAKRSCEHCNEAGWND